VLEVSSARSKLDGVLQTLVEKQDERFVERMSARHCLVSSVDTWHTRTHQEMR